jgi:hypothetical protein
LHKQINDHDRAQRLACGDRVLATVRCFDRREPRISNECGDEFLMSSLFTVAEVELARLGLAEAVHTDLDVVVGVAGNES